MRFYSLAQELGDDQPFFGFQAAHPSEFEGQHPSIEDMAGAYIESMRAVQAEGPYFIGGYSFGSVVAFEMAQQLINRGQRVGLVALLDGGSPAIYRAAPERSDAVVLAGFARDLARMSGVEIDLPHQRIREMGPEEGILYVMESLKRHRLTAAETEATYFRHFVRGLRLRTQAVREYEPQVYPGAIDLFRSSEVERESAAAWREVGIDAADRARGWDRLTSKPLEIHSVPGHHATMINKPHVAVLAEQLRARLAGAQRT
jgi:thioesterase domain-containing protein